MAVSLIEISEQAIRIALCILMISLIFPRLIL
jgi:hypothetical protein